MFHFCLIKVTSYKDNHLTSDVLINDLLRTICVICTINILSIEIKYNSSSFSIHFSLHIYIYIYIYMYMYMCVCVYTYAYIYCISSLKICIAGCYYN